MSDVTPEQPGADQASTDQLIANPRRVRSKRTTALALAAGALTLGAGVGVASFAAADPTPTPSSSSSAGAPSSGTASTEANGDRRGGGPGGRGHDGSTHNTELAQTLATKLGVTEAEVAEALKAIHDDSEPTARPSAGTERPDPAARQTALAKALASKLGVTEAKVAAALGEIQSARQAERAAALKTTLDAAVQAGTLTQAESDAVTKAVEKGVIHAGGGPR